MNLRSYTLDVKLPDGQDFTFTFSEPKGKAELDYKAFCRSEYQKAVADGIVEKFKAPPGFGIGDPYGSAVCLQPGECLRFWMRLSLLPKHPANTKEEVAALDDQIAWLVNTYQMEVLAIAIMLNPQYKRIYSALNAEQRAQFPNLIAPS
jgi:hypothetical protein